ncbi:DUF551 domain-containing protein [Chitinophaga sp. HK235]|uniref:DUF551 domain-containing protein n=1 Tax=Chitinophaga sp. HK235 TaxID=2952571 RepID=UPI0035B06DF5
MKLSAGRSRAMTEKIMDILKKWLSTNDNRIIYGMPDAAKEIAQMMRWIPVYEALPESLSYCLFVIDDVDGPLHGKVMGGIYTGDPDSRHLRKIFSTPGAWWNASHWMPSPEPPAQEGGNR